MELNREQVIKALKCWTSPAMLENTSCVGCYFETKGLCEQNCTMDLADVALALIKELTEEIKDLEADYDRVYEQAEADIVRCKYCQHSEYNDYHGVYYCRKLRSFTNDEFYCAYGEEE